MPILLLAWRSLLNRRGTAVLTLFSIALSVTLLLGVERLRTEVRTGFTNSLSGTDLVVGARSGPVQLMLYAVFRIGEATSNLSWSSYEAILAHPKVAWAIPISLGDSHRGYPVVGTTPAYFEHYQYGGGRALALREGRVFADLYDAVLGAEVARALGYALDDPVVLAHGASDVAFARHAGHPFRVAGILQPTGTPVDRSVHVRLEGLEAIHLGWEGGAAPLGEGVTPEQARQMDLSPTAVTAALVGLRSRIATFQVQRFVNSYPAEPLLAVLPGVALSQLWDLIGVAERVLLLISGLVVLVGLFGLLASLLTGLEGRRREMAILRSVGAQPWHLMALILGEVLVLTLCGMLLGLALLYLLLLGAQPLIMERMGVLLAIGPPTGSEILLLGAVLSAGLLAGLVPAYRAYRLSLADGLSIRV